MNSPRQLATLEPVRFGEFLLLRNLISDEQWLAALAEHWSTTPGSSRRSIGATIMANGFLPKDVIERAMQGVGVVYHLAAVFREARHRDLRYREVNVEASRLLLEAAVSASVSRYVH
jgi:nucleoside-diphosphate-sugar epimerase